MSDGRMATRAINTVETRQEVEVHDSPIENVRDDEACDAVEALGELVLEKKAETAIPSPKCYLLALAGELQNKIYREVLLDPNHINVNRAGYKRSSLFGTCKQIRKAVASIYYLENTFKFRILNMDPTPMLFFDRSFAQLKLSKGAKWKAVVETRGSSPRWIEGDGSNKAAKSPDTFVWLGLNRSIPRQKNLEDKRNSRGKKSRARVDLSDAVRAFFSI